MKLLRVSVIAVMIIAVFSVRTVFACGTHYYNCMDQAGDTHSDCRDSEYTAFSDCMGANGGCNGDSQCVAGCWAGWHAGLRSCDSAYETDICYCQAFWCDPWIVCG